MDVWFWLLLVGLVTIGVVIFVLRKRKAKSVRRINKQGDTLFGKKQIQDWEKMFAWKPVQTIDQGYIWLRYYWRRKVYLPTDVDHLGNVTWPFYYQNVIKIGWYLW